MTDSLKERLRYGDLPDWKTLVDLAAEAADRIEELEEATKHHDYYRDLYKDQYERDKATIAKLETEIGRLRAELVISESGKLGQPY